MVVTLTLWYMSILLVQPMRETDISHNRQARTPHGDKKCTRTHQDRGPCRGARTTRRQADYNDPTYPQTQNTIFGTARVVLAAPTSLRGRWGAPPPSAWRSTGRAGVNPPGLYGQARTNNNKKKT